ncbi:hypothetical protein Spb1_07130 [Planctopirus ephydatiae]|uniref:Uncharacterized protein n=1 Tax=Planctopirus ephydatiae TaxID=2528019 RepID=A0A518GJU4_9PLAN|nr:hypothetical protein [Planctopirus ephydatiae]QDV28847.1 hypothetical protein Spb1_07130 [Planctopirus ephydatiae]
MANEQDTTGARGGVLSSLVARWIIRSILVCLAFAITVHLHDRIVLWNYLRECQANNILVAYHSSSLLPSHIRSKGLDTSWSRTIVFFFDLRPRRLLFMELVANSKTDLEESVVDIVDAYPFKSSVNHVDIERLSNPAVTINVFHRVLEWPSLERASLQVSSCWQCPIRCQGADCVAVRGLISEMKKSSESFSGCVDIRAISPEELPPGRLREILTITQRTPHFSSTLPFYLE